MATHIPRWLWSENEQEQSIKQGEVFIKNTETNSPILLLEHGERLCQRGNPHGLYRLKEALPLLTNEKEKQYCRTLLDSFQQQFNHRV